MTRDEIMILAIEADLAGSRDFFDSVCGFPKSYVSAILNFAALIAAHEREECAKVCDRLGDETGDANAADCAEAIRARGQE